MLTVLSVNSCIMILYNVQDGETPLYIASWKGHGAVVKLLLEQHADVSICQTVYMINCCYAVLLTLVVAILGYVLCIYDLPRKERHAAFYL